MKITKIRLVDVEGRVLDKKRDAINVNVFEENEGGVVTFSRFGRVLDRLEVVSDFSLLLARTEEFNIPTGKDFDVCSGRFEPHKTTNIYNCIVVSFGRGQEFAFYCIDQRGERELFNLYMKIRDISMVERRKPYSISKQASV